MKTILLIITALVAVTLIQASEAVEIKLDQRIHVGDLDLYFYDIEDSRCPLDVTCVWEGKVTAMILVQNQTHKISGYFTPGYTLSYITPYNVTLVAVNPHPISTEKPDYVAILDISKLGDGESLQKGETTDLAILGWVGLAGSLFIVAAYIIMKIKKRK